MPRNFTKIIAVLNDFSLVDTLLKKTFDFAYENGASIEILYVHESPLFDIPDYFRGDTKGELDKEKIKQKIKDKVATLKPKRDPAIFVQIDDTADRVWALAREDQSYLVITAYHDGITHKIVDKISQPILVLKSPIDRYKKLALILNATHTSIHCIEEVKSHFKESDIHLLYDYRYVVDPSMEVDLQNMQIIEQAQREAFEKIKQESGLEGDFFIDGSFFGNDLLEFIQTKAFDITYLCSQGDDFFVSDTLAEELLQESSCDIFIANKINEGVQP